MTITKIGIGIAAVALLALAVFLVVGQAQQVAGSTISEASDYRATSTAANGAYGAMTTGKNIKPGAGSFGSVIITGANTGLLNFYNATTSDVSKRTGNKATSTILLASFPASTAAGTYIFDAGYTDGLLMVLEAGIMPTTTVTYR